MIAKEGMYGKASRSPHGERGLKYTPDVGKADSTEVALLMESVD